MISSFKELDPLNLGSLESFLVRTNIESIINFDPVAVYYMQLWLITSYNAN